MNNKKIFEDTKIYNALRKSKHSKCFKNATQLNSGRFKGLDRFTKIQNYLLESLYTISDMHNPSAYRIYLYLLRHITGFENRSRIEYRIKKIKSQMNMGNSFYKAVKLLKDKNMLYFIEKEGNYYIGLNPYPDTWITDSKERIDEIIDHEVNQILERTDDEIVSISSSSWSSSSSSSYSFPSDDSGIDEILMKELEKM
jgi:hypothetical protein